MHRSTGCGEEEVWGEESGEEKLWEKGAVGRGEV